MERWEGGTDSDSVFERTLRRDQCPLNHGVCGLELLELGIRGLSKNVVCLEL